MMIRNLPPALLLASVCAAAPAVKIEKLVVEPSPLILSSAGEGRRVLVTGIAKDGERIDLTTAAVLKPAGENVKIEKDGFLYPVKEGETNILVTAAGQKAELPVQVMAMTEKGTSFLRDVTPILNKVGCTSGTCHGAAK